MTDNLRDYVRKHILNPVSTINVEDDGNEETHARISKKVKGREGSAGITSKGSSLRAQNVSTLAERDPKYCSKKVSREKQQSAQSKIDPELAKFLYIENGSDSGSEDNAQDESESMDGDNEEDMDEEGSDDESDEGSDGESEEGSEDESDAEGLSSLTELKTRIQLLNSTNNRDQDNSEDEELDIDSGDNEDENEVESDNSIEAPTISKTALIVSRADKDKDQGLAIINQKGIFDKLFETRTAMQKVIPLCNQLPQYDMFEEFKNNSVDETYLETISSTCKVARKMVTELIELQDLLLQQNDKTATVLEQITNDSDSEQQTGKKRKLLEMDCQLEKRHKAFIPYRDAILDNVSSNTNMLSEESTSQFKGFEVSAVTQLHNILADRETLLRRTRVRAVNRGSNHPILGKPESDDKYDAEIFDDSDFYAIYFDQALKKERVKNTKTRTSQSGANKRHEINPKASKGRLIKLITIKPMIGILAPVKYPIDVPVTSLFQDV